MARFRKKSKVVNFPVVEDAEKFLDGLANSVEGIGDTVVSYAEGLIEWLRKHKKLALTILVLVLAYRWAKSKPSDNDEEEEE